MFYRLTDNLFYCFRLFSKNQTCLLYTSDAADDLLCVDLGGRRIIKKKKKISSNSILNHLFTSLFYFIFFFFKQKTAYEIMPSLVGSEMCIRDSSSIASGCFRRTR